MKDPIHGHSLTTGTLYLYDGPRIVESYPATPQAPDDWQDSPERAALLEKRAALMERWQRAIEATEV